jgi:hypothetical protein
MCAPNYKCSFSFSLILFALLVLVSANLGFAASWTTVTTAPGNTGVMLQLTDGTVMVQSASDLRTWFKLKPDPNGNYATGSWTATAPMGTARLYFASHVLPDGRVWVLGGEYTGPINTFANWSNTGEIYDPVANTWTPIAAYPNQAGCPQLSTISGNLTNGSNIITAIYPNTNGLSVNEAIGGTGLPNTTIASIDSPTQIHVNVAATATAAGRLLGLGAVYQPAGCFGDDPTMLVPGGTAGKILAGDLLNANTFIYDIGTNSWTPGGTKLYGDSSDEEGWTKLADGSVLSYALFKSIGPPTGQYAQKYNPSTDTWTGASPSDGSALGSIPQLSSSALGFELGPVLRLQDGRAFVIGANQHTATYNPSTNTWTPGPDISGSLNGNAAPFGADDAPAAILPSGHVILAADAGPSPVVTTGDTTAGSTIITNIPSTALFQVGWSVAATNNSTSVIPSNTTIISIDSPNQVTISKAALATRAAYGITFGGIFSRPTQLFDYNPGANTITPVSPAIPDANLNTLPAFVTRMLVLPTGQLLFSDSGRQLYLYTGDGAAALALRPVINGISFTGPGTFALTGKQLNGQSAGSSYGDDVESDSNYPIVKMTNFAGQVFYGRTTNWTNYGVDGGLTQNQTVTFTLNPLVTAGNYLLTVSGAGIMSNPIVVSITAAQLNVP